jgi:Leucine-rich repeat (LRR) protein
MFLTVANYLKNLPYSPIKIDFNYQDQRIEQIVSDSMSIIPPLQQKPCAPSKIINQTQTIALDSKNLPEVSLNGHLDQAADTQLLRFFDRMIDQIPREMCPVLEGNTAVKAETIRDWMAKNTDILATITNLNLSKADLWTLPPEISLLTNLERLDLGFNHLSSLPSTFSKLTNLEQLFLNDNQISSLPTTFGQLTKLRWLYLNNNQLTSLPITFGQLANLKWLDLDHNQLTSLPVTFGQLYNLEALYLNDNRLILLDATFGQLTHLKWLDLGNNQLTSLPATFNQLTNLQRLDLDSLPKIYLHAQRALLASLSAISNRLFPSLNDLLQNVEF